MAILQKKSVTVDALKELENEQVTLRSRINETRDKQSDMQHELAGLLAAQRGLSHVRLPLQQASEAAQVTVREGQEALTRHIGQPTESVYADKLYEAQQQATAAAQALADFDKQTANAGKERIQELRERTQQAEQALVMLEQRQTVLTGEIDQMVTAQRVNALSRLLTAYQDLYTILESDGEALVRMHNRDTHEFELLIRELTLSRDELWDMICPQHGYADDFRPLLRDRQQAIRDRLAHLKK